MTAWKPIIAGIDESPDSAWAAAMAWQIAQAAQTGCYLVHGTRRVSDIPIMPKIPIAREQLTERVTAAVREQLKAALEGNVPPRTLEHLEVRLGNATWVLRHAVEQHDAGMVVLGGKHHHPTARWVGGSTAHHVVRTIDVPLLVTWTPRRAVRRLLVALDLSETAKPILELARRFGELFDAELKIVHVIEALQLVDEVALPFNEWDYTERSTEALDQMLAEFFGNENTERTVRRGVPSREISMEAAAWNADVVVVGSHGKGWVDRVLIGSTTERLLNHLPTSLLVAPVASRVRRHGERGPAEGASLSTTS